MTTLDCISLRDLADRWSGYSFNGVSHFTLIERLAASGDLPTYERDKAGYHLDGVEYWDLLPIQRAFPQQEFEDVAQYGDMPAMQQDLVEAELHDVEPICAGLFSPWSAVLSQEGKMPGFKPSPSRADASLALFREKQAANTGEENAEAVQCDPMPGEDAKATENGTQEALAASNGILSLIAAWKKEGRTLQEIAKRLHAKKYGFSYPAIACLLYPGKGVTWSAVEKWRSKAGLPTEEQTEAK